MRSPALRIVTVAASLLITSVGAAHPVAARVHDPVARGLSATALVPHGRVEGVRAPSSRLARSDDTLLARADADIVPVLLKLDQEPLASYAGGITGLPATSPATTGRPLTESLATTSPYAQALREAEAQVTAAIAQAVPEAEVVGALRIVYGGLVATVPANRARRLLDVPNVVAVQADGLRQPVPLEAPTAPPPPDPPPDARAGTGVVIATLGVGGRPLLDRYRSVPDVPDPDAGTSELPPPERGAALAAEARRSAPGARTVGYQVCGALGCFVSDLAAGVEASLLDGAEVLTHGLTRGDDVLTDPVQLALLGAHAAGLVVVEPGDRPGPVPPWVVPGGTGGPAAAARRAGAVAVVREQHPDWSPAQVGSALQATTEGDDPAAPGLTLDETPTRFAQLGGDPSHALHLNMPTIDASLARGPVTARRAVTNVSDDPVTYRAEATSPEGAAIAVQPRRFTVGRGVTKVLTLTLTSEGLDGRGIGEVRLVAEDRPTIRLPVSVTGLPGEIAVASECDAGPVGMGDPAACRVTATNVGTGATAVTGTTSVDAHLRVDAVGAPATVATARRATLPPTTLAGRGGAAPRLAPATSDRYVALDELGITPIAMGDDEALNVDLDRPFTFEGTPYDRIGVASDGYLLVGGAQGPDDIACCAGADGPGRIGDVIAPFWTDLTGVGAPGVLLAEVTDGSRSWIVVEWRLDTARSGDRKTFQVWLSQGAAQEVTLAYPAGDPPDRRGLSTELAIGATSDAPGTGNLRIDRAPAVPPGARSADIEVLPSEPAGRSVTYVVEVVGYAGGAGTVRSELRATGASPAAAHVAVVPVSGPAPGEVEAVVDRVARRLLGDDPAPDPRGGWADRIRTSTLTRQGLAREMADDPAWRGRLVEGHYREVTGSPPDPAGRAFWVAELATAPEHRLVAQLVGSTTFWNLVDHDPATFVEQAFRVVVGRPPEPTGRAYWVDRLSEGLPRAEMAKAIASQDEVQQRRVSDLTRLLLDRAPTPAERSRWASQLRTGSVVDLTADILLAS